MFYDDCKDVGKIKHYKQVMEVLVQIFNDQSEPSLQLSVSQTDTYTKQTDIVMW